MDELSVIYKYLPLAERAGKRYARKHDKYEPECIAESYYILFNLVRFKLPLLDHAEDKEVYLRISISNGLTMYFRPKRNSETTGSDLKLANKSEPDETAIIDLLESIIPNHPEIFRLWRQGFRLDDLKFLNPRTPKIIKEMVKVQRTLVRERKKLKSLGVLKDETLPEVLDAVA